MLCSRSNTLPGTVVRQLVNFWTSGGSSNSYCILQILWLLGSLNPMYRFTSVIQMRGLVDPRCTVTVGRLR